MTNNKEEILKFLDEAFTSYEREMIDLYAKNVAIEFREWTLNVSLSELDKLAGDKAASYYQTPDLYSLWEQTKK